ncbi:MAG: 4-hydroxy-tetrahydrodipicolinate reductase [Candidatus Omnitrophica bacterium]|nr:4-hydroxy-tetrahydrodipicolinate reductase [Candidatus Omnitrophota bacterium]MCM8793814.1 4-hydroxy-tetrahydrodipicolinate reductase [Candidatus Omnitrophota bacterium]
MIRLAVSGACGKMGSRIIDLASKEKDFQLTVLLEAKGHQKIGSIVYGVKISDNPEEIKNGDCLIEFTNPLATIEHLNICVKYNKAMVIGTTGLSEEEKMKVKDASRYIPIVFSPNMSVGVNLLFRLVREAASLLSEYNVRIIEAHHIHKKDAPSGTAKMLAEIIKRQTGKEVKDIKSIREGEIVGDHRVIFDSPYDTIELFHSAKTRDIFAKGALIAARFVVRQKTGLFDMEAVR